MVKTKMQLRRASRHDLEVTIAELKHAVEVAESTAVSGPQALPGASPRV